MARIADRLFRPLLSLGIGATCLLLLAATGSSGAPVASVALPEGALRPTLRQQMLAPRIASILEQTHFSRRTIDDNFSAQVFDHYLNALDGQHSYFLATDISGLQQWRNAFDDMIHTGQIEPAYAICLLYTSPSPRD